MTFNSEFEEFLSGWQAKADAIPSETLANMFDKFFTLFVIHNRLYAMATFCLWSESGGTPLKRFPDTEAASKNLAKFLGSAKFMSEVTNDASVKDAFDEIKRLLRGGQFHFKLKMPYATSDVEADKKLLSEMDSPDDNRKATALLEILHCLRCNMFHGSKNFDLVQQQVLQPATVLLKKVICLSKSELKVRAEPKREC